MSLSNVHALMIRLFNMTYLHSLSENPPKIDCRSSVAGGRSCTLKIVVSEIDSVHVDPSRKIQCQRNKKNQETVNFFEILECTYACSPSGSPLSQFRFIPAPPRHAHMFLQGHLRHDPRPRPHLPYLLDPRNNSLCKRPVPRLDPSIPLACLLLLW